MKTQEKEQLEENQKLEGKTKDLKEKTSKKLTKATENQISIKFESSFSNLIKDEKEGIDEQKDINKFLWDQQVKARVYFIRHGESVEDDGKWGLQSSEAELSEHWRENLEKVVVEVREKCLNNKNTYLLSYNGWKEEIKRVKESCDIINQELWLEETRIDNNVIWLHTTDKSETNPTKRMWDILPEIWAFCKELVGKIQWKENINIVCVMHKSNIGYIKSYFFKKDGEAVSLSHDGMTPGEIREVDFTLEGKALNYGVNKTILSINSEDCDVLLGALEEKVLKAYVNRFRAGELQIWELQNLVNMYFQKNPKLFEGCLLSENRDLRIFCISNLLVEGKFDVVDTKMKALLEMEKVTEIVDFVDTILSICTEKERKNLLKIIVNKRSLLPELKLWKLEYYANYEKYVKKNIRKIRKKTLDERLKKWENVIIPLGFEDDKYKTMDELVTWSWITLIEWEAGAGKTTKLLEIMEYLKPDNREEVDYIFPVYINLWETKFEDIPDKIEEQTGKLYSKGKYKFVYLFDAMDEARYDDETKKNFQNYLYKFQGKVIITSRPNNIQIVSNHIEISGYMRDFIQKVNLKPLDKEQIEEYIKTHLSEKQALIWEEWKEKEFIKWIESNPLMLSIVCNLLVSWDNLEGIETKADLYDRIVDARLRNWEENKEKRETNKNKIKYRRDLLSEIAYDSLILWKKVDSEHILELIDGNDNYKLVIPYDQNLWYDLECLNMIFRKNKEGEYSFVHESFREFFAAKLEKDNFIKINGYNSLFIGRIGNISLDFIDFFVSSLDFSSKNDFLEEFKRNEKNFSIFDSEKRLYLLWKIEINYLFEYIKHITIDSSIAKVLFKLGEPFLERLKLIKNIETEYLVLECIKILWNSWKDRDIKIIRWFINHESTQVVIKVIEILWFEWGKENMDIVRWARFTDNKKVLVSVIAALGNNICEENIKILRSFKNYKNITKRVFFYWGRNIPEFKNYWRISLIIKIIESLGKSWKKEDIKIIKSFLIHNSWVIIQKIIEVLMEIWWEYNMSTVNNLIRENLISIKEKDLNFKESIINYLEKEGWKENIKLVDLLNKQDSSFSIMNKVIETLEEIWTNESIQIIRDFSNYRLIDGEYDGWSLNKRTASELWGLLEWNIEKRKKLFSSISKNRITDKKWELRISSAMKIIEILEKRWEKEDLEAIKNFAYNSNREEIIFAIIEVFLRVWWEDSMNFIMWFKSSKNPIIIRKLFDILLERWFKDALKQIIGQEEHDVIEKMKVVWNYGDYIIRDMDYFARIKIVLYVVKIFLNEWFEWNIEWIRLFKKHKSPELVAGVIKLLWDIYGKKSLNLIKEFEVLDNKIVNIQIIKTLINIGWKDNLSYVKKFKNHDESSVRRLLLEEFVKLDWKQDISFIKEFLKDDDDGIVNYVVDFLFKIGWEENISEVKKLLYHKDWHIVASIIEAFWKEDKENNLDLIRAFKTDNRRPVMIVLARIFFELRWEDLNYLENLKNERFSLLIGIFIKKMEKEGIEKYIHIIRYFKNSECSKIQEKLIWILWEYGWEEDIKWIKWFVKHEKSYIMDNVVNVLARVWWEEELNLIREIKKTADRRLSGSIIMYLSYFWWKERIEIIKSFKDSKNTYVLERMIESLWKIWWEENIAFIRQFENHYEDDVKWAARNILKKLW